MGESNSNMRRTTLIGVAAIVLIGLGVWFSMHSGSTVNRLVAGEKIQNWNFQGAYTGNADLEKRAADEIARLQLQIGKGPETDYSYYVSIASQYDLLGDGKNEYVYLNKALGIDAEHTGLAWFNLGALFERLGALKSARESYRRAAAAQNYQQYVNAYLEFLTQHFPDDETAINEAYSIAQQILGESPGLLEIRARWLEEKGKYKEALDDWRKIKTLTPNASAAIDLEIKRLESKLQD